MTESGNISKTDISEVMAVMDVVDALRREEAVVNEHLEDKKSEIKKKLKDTYEQMGVKVSDFQLEKALDDHYSQRWRFERPENNLATKLATAYINRKKIAIGTGFAAALIGTVGLGVLGIKSGIEATERAAERKVELEVRQAYDDRNFTRSNLESLTSSPYFSQLPQNEADSIKTSVTSNLETLTNADIFFNEYCPEGNPKEAVTLDNFRDVDKNLDGVHRILANVGSSLDKNKNILNDQQKYILIRNELDNTISQIRGSKAPEKLKGRADLVYRDGITSINNRQLESAKKFNSELSGINLGIGPFIEMTEDSKELYDSINKIALENEAKEMASMYYSSAQSCIDFGDINGLRNSVNNMKELNSTLRQEYRIELVPDSDGKSGVDRYYDGNRLSGYYVFVAAVDSRGSRIPMRILNEETKNSDSVTIWGEKVGDARYDDVWNRLVADKRDNGHIDNSNVGKGIENRYFAQKKMGYLNVEVLMTDNNRRPLERSGQITRW